MKIKTHHILLPVLTAFCLFAAFLTTVSMAAPGDLDLSFGNGGIVVTGPVSDGVQAMAIQSDGKIVVVGDAQGFFAVVRYNTNGSLDTSFGGTGIGWTPVGRASSVAIQADGKIVVVGGTRGITIVRYNPNGSLDPSFGGTGIITSFGNSNFAVTSVKIQSDGKIIAAGTSGDSPNKNFAIVRYNTHGSLDGSFGGTGIVIIDFAGLNDQAASVAIQPDGKIVVGGSSYRANDAHLAVVRLDQNGSPDITFNGTGRIITPITDAYNYAASIAIQPDGKIIAAGTSGGDFAFARYSTDGSLDTSFGGTGMVSIGIGNSGDFANSVAIQTDGKIVAAGFSYRAAYGSPSFISGNDFAVVRLDQNGSPDTTFNCTGRVITPTTGGYDYAASVAIQADGKIVVAGAGDYGSDYYNFVVVRYLAASAPCVDVSGRVTTPEGRGLRNAVVTITDPLGVGRTVTTSSFGNYTFENIVTNQIYTVAVSSKRFRFTAREVQLNGALTNLDFIGQE